KNNVEIELHDSGKGIEMKRRKDVFRPGYSTKKRGWGLGLSLSKRIIESYHGGKIFVKYSAPGEGTTFKIILPK
ncbi:MAG TPA: ATP-binding protein, partial [Ignavibacteriaceae bacterium]